MATDMTILAAVSDWIPWYTWVLAGVLVIVLIAYKIYQNKMMG